jgi:Zn-dependent peptidase ImmA (M78 family)
MYASSGGGVIVVSSLRPAGRQAYTCAHELGHHVLGHGSRWDEYLGEGSSVTPQAPEEWAADRFGSYLLMPKQAVLRSFALRGWQPQNSSPEQILIIAGELGVGYAALLNQMRWSLGLLDSRRTNDLIKLAPKAIREAIAGRDCPGQLFILDQGWVRKSLDIQVGDFVLLPADAVVRGQSVRQEGAPNVYQLFLGVHPGITQALRPGTPWACFIRVSKKDYAGRATFRHLEDPDAE